MVADTEGVPPFPMFAGVQGDVRYLDPKEAFGHESYTSAYLMRLAGEGSFPVPDADLLQGQRSIYQSLLDELLYFLQQQAGMPLDVPHYRGSDLFHRR
jgi:hypothetical protein